MLNNYFRSIGKQVASIDIYILISLGTSFPMASACMSVLCFREKFYPERYASGKLVPFLYVFGLTRSPDIEPETSRARSRRSVFTELSIPFESTFIKTNAGSVLWKTIHFHLHKVNNYSEDMCLFSCHSRVFLSHIISESETMWPTKTWFESKDISQFYLCW